MFRQSQNPISSADLNSALLAALSTRPAAALWTTPKAILWVNNFYPTFQTALTDLTEATFGGYTAGGVALPTLVGPVNLAEGGKAMIGDVSFLADGTITPPGETAYGYAVVGNAGADLYLVERFIDPVPFANAGDFLDLAVVFPEDANRNALTN